MKAKRPIKHLPKPIRKLVKLFFASTIDNEKQFLLEEVNYYGHSHLASELELNDKQNKIKNN